MESALVVGLIIMVGLAMGETARLVRLPKITGYIVAGIVLNPRLTGWIPVDFVHHTGGITDIALAFITFSVGGTLLISRLKRLGKGIITIALLEAELAFFLRYSGFLRLPICWDTAFRDMNTPCCCRYAYFWEPRPRQLTPPLLWP